MLKSVWGKKTGYQLLISKDAFYNVEIVLNHIMNLVVLKVQIVLLLFQNVFHQIRQWLFSLNT